MEVCEFHNESVDLDYTETNWHTMQSLIYWMRNFKILKSHDIYKLMHEPNIISRKEWDRKRERE